MRASSLWRRLFLCAVVLLSAEGALAQTADLSASLFDTPDPMTLGTGTVTYTAGLFNGGGSAATNATITFNAPAGSTIGTVTPNLSGSCNTIGQTVTCTWSSVASGSTRSVSVVTTPTGGGTLTASATVSATETDPNSANNTASTTTTVNANIDLRIYQMSDTPDPITLGTGDITYTTYIYNASSSKATNPVLTLTLPAASTFVSASASNSGTCSGTTTVTCSWAGDLSSGGTRYVTLVVTPTAGGTLTLSAAVDGDQPDDVPANDTATHSTTVNANIDLRIYQMSDTPDPITLGTGDITYTTYIYNASSSKATNPVLTLTLPAASTFVSASASLSGTCSGTTTVTCSWAGDLSSGGTRYVTLVVTPTAGGTLTLSAAVDGDQPDDVPANDTATHSTTVNANIDLRIYQMSDTPDPITLGTGDITYTTYIYNASSSKATNPVLTLTIPAASTFVSAAASNSGTCSGTATVTCSWAGDLASGSTRYVTLVVTPTAGGTATLSAAVDGDQPDNVPANDTATHSTTVNEFIDLRIYSMSDTPDPITLGTGNITYTTYIYNASSSKATNPVLTLTLPASTTFVSAAASNSGSCSGTATVTCSWAGDLTSGATRFVTLVVTPTAGGTATLAAAVDGDQPDNINANDSATHSTTVNEFIDLQIYSMFDTPDPITLGTGNITYTTYIYNSSSSKATNPVLTLTRPAASTFVSATASNSGTCSGTATITCSWPGDMTSGSTRNVTLIVTPTAGGTATLTAAVDGDQPDNTNGNDTASHSTTVNEFIDLQVYSMFDSPDPITLGTGNITYTTYIYNASSSKATNAVLTLTRPAASTFVSATASNSGTCSGTATITCSWAGDMTSGSTRNVTLIVTPTAGGTATLTAAVDGDQPDNVNANDTASHSTTVNEFIDLQVYSMFDTPDPITLGTGNITYTTYIYNASSSKATNPVLTLAIPASSTFVSATASNSGSCSGTTTVTCSWAGDMTSGSTRNVTLIVTPTAGGTLTLNAAVDGDQPDNVSGNDTGTHSTTVNASIELSVSMSDSPDPRVIGAGNVTYSTFILNSSSSKATTPKITFTIPSTTSYVSHTAASATCTVGASTVECTWTDVSGGSSRSASFVVSPSQVGQLSATITVTSDQPDPNSANNTDTETTNVNPGTAPSISSFSPTSGPVGTTVTISGSSFFSATAVKFNGISATYVVNNNGSITATVPSGATTGTVSVTNANGTGTSTGQFTVTPAPDLAITKTASAGTTPTGSSFSYTLAVSNVGAGSAADVTVTDVLPAGVTLTSASGTNWSCSGTTTITCTHGALAASTSAPSITINVTAPSSGTTVTNTATVDSSTPDNNAANDSSTVSVGVVGCPTTPAITAPATVCSNSTGHVASTPSVPGATYAWSITNGTITSAISGETITFDAGSTDPVTLSVSVFVTSCPTAMNSVNVNVSTPTASITASGPTTFCSGSSVTLTANNGASYLWSTGQTTQSITVAASGNYDVAVTDAAGCTVTSAPTTVTVDPAPTATITAGGPDTFCEGGSVTLNGPAGMASYLWSNGATTPSIVADASGAYTVTVTTAAGCSATSAPFNVTETPAPSAAITPDGPTTFCAGEDVVLTASNGASWLWSTGQTTQSITVTAAGDYDVTVTGGGGCSATSATVTVTVNPLPAPSISGPASACGSATLDAGSGYVSYAWSHGPTTQTVNVTTGGTYSVTVTDANGCSATASHNLAITSAPPLTIQGPATVCSNDLPVTLDAGSGFVSYAWAHGPTTQTVSVSSAGSYSVTVTDANGCTATATHNLIVNPTPAATITPSGPTTFCDGGSVTLTANAAQSYAWSNGETTQSITVSANGTFTVTTTDNACSATSAPVTVTVNPPPGVTITGPATACSSNPATLDAGPGFVSYLWSTGETTQTINATATATYGVTVTDANGCTAAATHDVTVTVTPANAVATSGPTTFCDGGSVTLTASPAASYAWSNGETTQSIVVSGSGTFTVTTSNGACSATSSPVVVTENPPANVIITGPSSACGSATLDAGPGFVSYLWSTGETTQTINVIATGTYGVTVTDANGCTAGDSHPVTITTTPAATITHSGPLTFCDGGSVTLTASPAASYAWSNGETTQSIVVSGSGTFTVTTSNGACSATSSPVVVTENPPANVTITGPSSACDSATLDAGPGFVSYLWSTGETTQTINAIATGTYSVTVTDANGCTAGDSHPVTITTTPAATITHSGPLTFCDGGSVTLTASPAVSYAWSNGETTQSITVSGSGTFTVTTTDGACSSTSAPIVVTEHPPTTVTITSTQDACGDGTLDAGPGFVSYLWSTGETTQSIAIGNAGNYSVTVTDANGCTATDSHTITMPPQVAPTIAASGSTTFCQGGSVTLTANPGGTNYLWSTGETTQSITVTAGGTYSVTWTDSCGNTATPAPKSVTVHPTPAVIITANVNECADGTLDAGPGFTSYSWSTGQTSQVISVTDPGTYTVTVTDANGCTATNSFTVTLPPVPAPVITVFGPLTFCEGGSVTLSASSAGTNFLWSNGATTPSITVTTSGTYSVTWTTSCGGGANPEPKTVTVKPTPSAAITAPTTASEGAANLAAGVAAQDGATYAWSISNGTITSGAGTNAITFTAGSAGTATLTATVTLGTCSATDTHEVTVTGQTVNEADVFLTKSAPPSVAAGASFSYTLVAVNHGPSNATSVVLSDTLPAGVTLTSVNGGAFQCSTLPAGIFCSGPLAVNTANTVTLSVTAPQQAGTITNTASIDGGLADPEPTNNSSSATTNVTLVDTCGTNAAPQLNAPSAGATLSSPVTFAWSAVPNAIGYRVWVEVNGTAAQDAGTTGGAISLIANVPPGAVVAYVDALFDGCNATRSTPVTFNVIPADPCQNRATPALIAPANNATLASSTVNLRWTVANGATGYRIWAIIDGAAPAVIGTTTGATSLEVVIAHGSVEWWAEALYQGCASTESAHAHFTIPRRNDCSPQTPEARSPSGVTVTTAEVTFQWTPVPNAVEYEVWLAVDNGTPTLIGTTTATSLTETVAPGVLDWFVRAIVSGCPPRDSQTLRFTYTPPANCSGAQRPNAVSPLPDAHVTSPVDFAWTPSAGATLYELFEVHGNDEELLASTSNAFANDVALPNGNTRWFVRAHFGAGCSPLDSAEQQLIVVPTPAACAELRPPRIAAIGQISSGLPVVMQWNEIPGATSYQLQLASDASFTNAEVITTAATMHTLTRTNTGNTPLAVHARVRAVDARCTPEATVTPYGPGAVVFILPVAGNEIAAPLTGGIVTQQLVIGPELAGQTFVAAANQPWLSVFPDSGVVGPDGTTFAVSAITNGLPIGTSLGAVYIDLTPPSFGSVRTNAASRSTTTISIGKVTPVMPTPKTAPPPDALIIPAVAHADGINSRFQSDVRVTNSSAQLLNYQVSFIPTGAAGIANGRQTQFSIEPGRTIALDDVLKSWFGTGGESVTGTLEVRPLTQTATSTSSNALSGLPNLVTFASSRTFNVTANGTFGQYIPAIPFANFIGKGTDLARPAILSLQQIAQSDRYRTNLGIVEGSGDAVNLLVKVFGNNGAKLTEFPVNLAGGQHTQLNSFLVAQGVGPVTDGRIEVSVVGGNGKVTAYASVLDNDTSDPLLVTPVTLSDAGTNRWVMPGVADLDNGTANWQTDMRVFNAGTTDVDTTLTFYSQNGGAPKTAQITIPAGQVKQFDRTLATVFGASNDGGAVHITTAASARLIATARTYNQTNTGTYGQFISAVTTSEAAGVGSRPLQLLQVEESDRFRSNIGLAEVTGNPVKLELSIVPPDAKFTAVTEVTLQANEFRQLNSLLRSAGLGETYNARVTVRAIDGTGRVTAYASVIDMLTNDPTYVPAQ